jgi:alkylation response protein AidB-like acyl-CoA dehydrogenase
MQQTTEAFRKRLREWLCDNLSQQASTPHTAARQDPARHRELQRRLFEGGFAGLTYPAIYGGQGLTAEFQDVFNEEAVGYELPTLFNVTLGILGPTILDFGTEEQKERHLPAILRGDELWVQLLSEPSGGSDLAACVTRADRDGDKWVLNGSKIWSTRAHSSDYALCLARSDWSLPKHRGLTMFLMKLHQPGIDIEPIRQSNGDSEFCQEFITDLAIHDGDTLGGENAGWEVARQLLYHERNVAGSASPHTYGFVADGMRVAPTAAELLDIARGARVAGDRRVRALVAGARAHDTIQEQLVTRIGTGIAKGMLPPTSGSLLRLFEITKVLYCSNASLDIAQSDAVVWPASLTGSLGNQFLIRQSAALAGGSIEMQRNIIAERVLGLPREPSPDVGVPFDSVPHNAPGNRW